MERAIVAIEGELADRLKVLEERAEAARGPALAHADATTTSR